MASELYRKGMEEMRKHLGPQADRYVENIREISPEFAKVNVEFPFGELYTRDILDDKTRELCTVAALTVQGFSTPELKIHVQAALNCGASRVEIVEVIYPNDRLLWLSRRNQRSDGHESGLRRTGFMTLFLLRKIIFHFPWILQGS